jgi:hypothetical protein
MSLPSLQLLFLLLLLRTPPLSSLLDRDTCFEEEVAVVVHDCTASPNQQIQSSNTLYLLRQSLVGWIVVQWRLADLTNTLFDS